jgi:hypothetical protein
MNFVILLRVETESDRSSMELLCAFPAISDCEAHFVPTEFDFSIHYHQIKPLFPGRCISFPAFSAIVGSNRGQHLRCGRRSEWRCGSRGDAEAGEYRAADDLSGSF